MSSTERIILTELNDWIKTHFTNQRNNYKKLEVLLLESSDFSYDFQFIYNNVDNTNQIQKVYKRINNVESSIRNAIDFEYLNSDIFESEHEFEHLPGFKEIKIKTLELNQKIANDGYVTNYNKQTNLNSLIFKVEDLINQKKQYIDDNPRGFKADYLWYNYINRLDKNAYVLIEELQNHSDWLSSFGISYFNKLLRSYASDDLPTDEYLIDDLIANKVKLQTNQIDFINNIWYNKQNEKVLNFDAANPSLKVKNLYNLKSSTGHRRYSLRYIVEKDIDLFTTFFPIILTTPDVASNLFKYNRYFDIVLFDEASQLKLEDNVPAMLKGKQIVIAGDEHQMPPSSYFSKIYDGEVESEEDIIDDDSEIKKDKSSIDALALSCSSLLEFGTEMNFKIKSLDFHYRSKHPYLIEFSNYAFYKQKLKAMPKTLEYKPISYVKVNGIFENRVNHIEADRVLDILENNINRKKDNRYPTVGIATFNITQRDLIKAKIVERQKHERYREFNEKIFELEKDGLFIKNLENIQGDERDIIIISTTYGVDTGGGFYERFGPINFEKGYKLLNVIITRARYKNYIVTSIPEDRILNFKSYLVTQQSNNKKAVFYAYLAYAKAVSENNEELRLSVIDALKSNYVLEAYSDYDTDPPLESPFEEEVYERLSQSIDKKFLKPQYKVGGFRIDMVIDFAIPYIPKIAIECDGAKYHSSNEAYLYDTHRQNILESQGFVFHRIWGTNWWRDPNNEFKKLINFIDVQKNIKFDNSEIYNLNQLAFDDIDL
ncbi:AAA domain-containing protein [Flavobacterium sp. RHBU_24]|uniref:AAA domain-containing protein n=1 Tax=Flavobacterium sp. RHBU_24 TaxID=3391185 RepID=UPI00398467F6